MRRHAVLWTIILVPFLCTESGWAEGRWNALSFRGFAGGVENGGRIDSRDGYDALDIGGELVVGIAVTMVTSGRNDLDFELSQMDSIDAQRATGGDDYIHLDLEFNKLSITGKRRYSFDEGLFCPWWGGGIDAGLLTIHEQEVMSVAGGTLAKEALTRVSNTFGVHGGAGIDIYPLRQSSLALLAEVRYSVYQTTGPFEGDLDGYAFFLGVRWDFWQCGM